MSLISFASLKISEKFIRELLPPCPRPCAGKWPLQLLVHTWNFGDCGARGREKEKHWCHFDRIAKGVGLGGIGVVRDGGI